ncbi:hypothetical protein Tco_0855919 [Tanacetum coccineum]
MFLNVDQLEKQLDKEEFQEIGSMTALKVLETQFQKFIKSRIYLDDEYKSIDKRALHKREYDSRVNERKMLTTEQNVDTSKALDARTKSKKQNTSSSSENDADTDDADIKLVYDKGSMAERKAKKKRHKKACRNRNLAVSPSARSQSTTNGCKPKPRINNQKSRNWPASKSSCVTTKTVPIAEHSRNSRSFSDSKHFVCSTCQKCVFNANHDSCVTKFLNEVNSRAKVPSHKTTTRYKPVEQTSVAKKPERQIPKRHRSSIKKTSVVHEKTMTPRSCLRWKPTGKIFKTVGLKWIPTGKILTSSTTKVDSEPTNGSNDDITNQYECKQTLDVSAAMTSDHNSSELRIHDHSNEPSSSKLVPKVVPPADKTATSRQELELLFHHHITMLRSYALSWKPCQGDSLNLPDHSEGDFGFRHDSKGDVLFLEELLNNDSLSLPEYESFHVDFYNVPSSPRPPEKPPDDDVYIDIEPDMGVLTTKVVDDISDNSTRELYVYMPNVLPTLPTLYPVFGTLLPFSSENEDKRSLQLAFFHQIIYSFLWEKLVLASFVVVISGVNDYSNDDHDTYDTTYDGDTSHDSSDCYSDCPLSSGYGNDASYGTICGGYGYSAPPLAVADSYYGCGYESSADYGCGYQSIAAGGWE